MKNKKMSANLQVAHLHLDTKYNVLKNGRKKPETLQCSAVGKKNNHEHEHRSI